MKITKDTPIGDIVRNYPESVQVFQRHGLSCLGCAVANMESLEEGALLHGINLDILLKELNEVAEEKSKERKEVDKD